MPTLPQSKLLAAVLAIAALLALPAAANATLSYSKGFVLHPRLFVAEDNGKHAHQIGTGTNSHVSPNGEFVAYENSRRNGAELRLYSLEAGKSERLLNPVVESFVFAWSPDSTMIAALTGGLNSPQTLVVINVETLKRTKVATGYFNGVSFAPDSEEIVYGVSGSTNYPLKSNLFSENVDGTGKFALSHDKNSAYPLWGPTGQIVFARQLGANRRKYGPENQLFVMNENGERISRLSHTKVNPLAQGLIPIAFAEDGKQLLTEFGGQDQGYAVVLNTVTGSEKKLTQNPETGFQGAAISPDGKTVLGTADLGFGGDLHPKVVTVPSTGGKQKLLVNGAYEPSWGG